MSKAKDQTKPKRFDVFQNLKWNVSIYSKNFGTKPKLFDLFQIFFSNRKTFLFIPKTWKQNQNVFDLVHKFLKPKRNVLKSPKKFGN
jgi:hypothetical protein